MDIEIFGRSTGAGHNTSRLLATMLQGNQTQTNHLANIDLDRKTTHKINIKKEAFGNESSTELNHFCRDLLELANRYRLLLQTLHIHMLNRLKSYRYFYI